MESSAEMDSVALRVKTLEDRLQTRHQYLVYDHPTRHTPQLTFWKLASSQRQAMSLSQALT